MCKVNKKLYIKIKIQNEENNCMENNFVDELLRIHTRVCRVTMFSTHTHTHTCAFGRIRCRKTNMTLGGEWKMPSMIYENVLTIQFFMKN